jgi:hypothetical protein
MKKEHHYSTNATVAQVQLGNPSLGCDRFGICRLLAVNQKVCAKCTASTLLASIYRNQQTLIFSFALNQMHQSIFEKYFASEVFIMEADFVLPLDWANNFDYNDSIVLQKGYYKINFEQQKAIFAIPYSTLSAFNHKENYTKSAEKLEKQVAQ